MSGLLIGMGSDLDLGPVPIGAYLKKQRVAIPESGSFFDLDLDGLVIPEQGHECGKAEVQLLLKEADPHQLLKRANLQSLAKDRLRKLRLSRAKLSRRQESSTGSVPILKSSLVSRMLTCSSGSTKSDAGKKPL